MNKNIVIPISIIVSLILAMALYYPGAKDKEALSRQKTTIVTEEPLQIFYNSAKSKPGVILTMIGEAGSSIIEVSVEGSGTWAQNGRDDDINGQTYWSDEIVGSNLAIKTSSSYSNAAKPLSGNITLINNGSKIGDLAFFVADDPGRHDDITLISKTKFISKFGESYRLTGKATFDLNEMGGSMYRGINATFDDLKIGTFTCTNTGENEHDFGTYTVIIKSK
ncbi:hypothetical protein PQO03_07670 [Lentisphaera profundi]|uniref:Uncharacterized protein n=1 Tax=Lentisphaera profundi TaxID=1658616 RepID=A0ABY7VNT0_9BACT|nr:hypothetical protein [Lentisphaera profundi]WDE95597.1 hypothetical protein PQO03_07670 [Lentisphaera profundi]